VAALREKVPVALAAGSVVLAWHDDGGEERTATTKIVGNGEFRGFVDDRARSVQVHVVPPPGYGEWSRRSTSSSTAVCEPLGCLKRRAPPPPGDPGSRASGSG